MKKFPPFLLFTFIFMLSLSCDHDEDPFTNAAEKTSDQNSSHPVTFLKATDVPNVVDRISQTSKRSKSQLSGRAGSFGYVLDMEHIIGVTDSVGNKTYAFRMYLENGNENAFYNLLVTERANGEEMPIAVLEYNMEPQYFEDRANGIEREGGYQRNILYYAFSDFSQIGSTGKNTPTRHKPNNPCGEVSGDINGTGGGDAPSAPGGGDGPQTGTSPGTSNSVGGSRAGGYGSVAGSATTPSQGSRGVVEVGDGCFCKKHAPKQEGDSQKGFGLASKDDDCPKGELLIPVNEEDDHVHLEDETKNPCIKQILTKLQRKDMQRLTVPDIGGLDGTGHLSQGILDLFDKSGKYDMTFKIGDTRANVNATTSTIKGGWSITLNDHYVKNATTLSIARTIIHESVHVYINYTLRNNRQSDMVKSLQAIHLRYSNSNNANNLTQHEFISQYVDALATSLSVWDSRVQDLSYYKKLAWAGLETSEAYKAQNNKSAIQSAIIAEQTSNNKAKGNKCD